MLRAATALGVGTEADIRDYFRLAPRQSKPAIAKLVADGELEQLEVDGWTAPAYCRPARSCRDAIAERRCCARSTR